MAFGERQSRSAGWHVSAFLSNLAPSGDFTVGLDVLVVEEDFGEESMGAKNIYKDRLVMIYVKSKTFKGVFSTKEKDQILQQAKRFK